MSSPAKTQEIVHLTFSIFEKTIHRKFNYLHCTELILGRWQFFHASALLVEPLTVELSYLSVLNAVNSSARRKVSTRLVS